MSDRLLARAVSAAAWEQRPDGPTWVPDDYEAEGFVHLSTHSQLQGTLDKHYAGVDDLQILWLDPAQLRAELRWEVAREGQEFPHLYGPMDVAAVVAVTPVIDGQAPHAPTAA